MKNRHIVSHIRKSLEEKDTKCLGETKFWFIDEGHIVHLYTLGNLILRKENDFYNAKNDRDNNTAIKISSVAITDQCDNIHLIQHVRINHRHRVWRLDNAG